MPPADALNVPPVKGGPVFQQRFFIGDMQTYHLVEITPTTNAGEVIKMIEEQGALEGWVGSGGWMVWEIAQDFGMGEFLDFP